MLDHGAVHAIEYAQSQLCDMIELGECGMKAASLKLRSCFFTLLHSLPLVCRSFMAKAREHEAFEYILFYERVRLGIASPYYFLDSIPATVQIFVGNTNVQLPISDIGRLKMADVVADRIQTVGKMETMKSGAGSRKAGLIESHASHMSGISGNIPGPARFLVMRTRAVCQTLRTAKRPDLFQNCANCNCQRLMYMGEPVESWAGAALASDACGEANEPADSSNYWHETMGEYSPPPDTRRFCSRSCATEHSTHLTRLMPDFGLDMDADDSAARHGRARVSEAFRLALKRNETAARSMRTMRTQNASRTAVSTSELKKHRRRRIKALNIDLGLLYAASVIAESKSLSTGKLLPGQSIYWRDNPSFYARALKTVKKLYESTRPHDDTIISSMLTTPRFIELLAARAFKIL